MGDGVRSCRTLAQLVIRGLHRLALDCARYRRVHHEFGKAVGGFIQRFGPGAQSLQIIALLEDAELCTERTNLCSLVRVKQLPGRAGRSLLHRAEDSVRFVPGLDQLTEMD